MTLIHWSQKERDFEFPKGFGFLMPRIYPWRVLGTLFPSQLFSKRSEDGSQLFASFYGGMLDRAAINLSQMPADALRQFATGLFEITY